ncbi:DUF2992 family protein [Dactylosporangium sp. NPDC000521]|uniref:DUF2992 family protein n=1 Tax=Dactylosporangium sp. NPDC000521 TaxID=3363975 RepID=UPI0036CB17B3
MPHAPAPRAEVPVRGPKRLARDAARAARVARPGTAAQEAVRKELELRKQASARRGREAREAHAEHRREVRRAKARERRRAIDGVRTEAPVRW